MTLPATVDRLEDLPEAVREHYVATEDGRFRLDAEGVEDVAGLKSALEKERAARKALKAELADRDAAPEADGEPMPDDAPAAADAPAAEAGTDAGAPDPRLAALEAGLIEAEARAALQAARGVPELLLPVLRERLAVADGVLVRTGPSRPRYARHLRATGNGRRRRSRPSPVGLRRPRESGGHEGSSSDVQAEQRRAVAGPNGRDRDHPVHGRADQQSVAGLRLAGQRLGSQRDHAVAAPHQAVGMAGLDLLDQLSAEEAATYGIAAIHVLPVPVIARHLRLELDDPAHPDGFLQAGRLVVGPAWQPRINLQYGWTIEQIDDSRTVRSRGGQSYVDVQPKYRRLRFSFDYLQRDEVFGHAYEMERLKGVGGDLMVMVDPDDPQHRHRHTVYGALTETTPIANPTPGRFAKTFTVDELL